MPDQLRTLTSAADHGHGAHADPGAITRAVVDAYRPGLLPPPPEPVTLPETRLRAYAGSYTLPWGSTVAVRVEDGGLTVEGMGRRARRYLPLGDDVFTNPEVDDRLHFVRITGYGIAEAWFGQPGAPVLRMRRVR